MMMTIENFLEKLKNKPAEMDFNELMELVDRYYDFKPTAFDNGDLHNNTGENSGSCKLFSFAQLNSLSEEQTLACFGIYYRDDVLKHPDADNHQNIRNFIKTGWRGITFDGDALQIK